MLVNTYIEHPAISHVDDKRCSDQGRNERSKDNRHRISSHSFSTLLRAPYIADDTTSIRDWRRQKCPGKEPSDEYGLYIFGSSGAKTEHCSNEVRYQYSRFAAV